MAIQPIDLQTMYSQMQNVARNVAVSQFQPQLTQQMREMSQVQQQQEQVQTVQRAADEESTATQVNEDGRGEQQAQGQRAKKRSPEETPVPAKKTEIREGYLGRHVDITR